MIKIGKLIEAKSKAEYKEMEEISVSEAFDDLTDCVVETGNDAMTKINSIEKEYKG